MQREKPLHGCNILVTREISQAKTFSRLLVEKGARSYECPLIIFSAPEDWEPVDRMLTQIGAYHGILFSSVNAVKFFFKRVQETGTPMESLQKVDCFAVGPATASALGKKGLSVKAIPERFQAEGLIDILKKEDLQGRRYLFPRARIAREALPQFLHEKGAHVDTAVVYETRKAVENEALLREILASVRLDCLTFTSPSTVRFFSEMAGHDTQPISWRKIPAACIGEITADAARAQGFHRLFIAPRSTIHSLVQEIVDSIKGVAK